MKLFTRCPISLLVLASAPLFASSYSTYTQFNLVSDIPGMAPATDPNLKDPWGVSFSATSPLWVSDRATGVSTLYTGTGSVIPLVVSVPPGAPAGPTGQVFSGGTAFSLNNKPAAFIFDTLGGTVDAWNGGKTATVVATTSGARYEGLALANNTLFAANFVSGGTINAFNSSYSAVSTSGGFKDPGIPTTYAPFNVQLLGGDLYVEYAKLNPNPAIPVAPPGAGGYVDVFDTNGTFVKRLVSNGALDAPWGIAMAPSSFGLFGGDLLIGNFGNGEINAYNPSTGSWLGTLTDSNGKPIDDPGLWALAFGNSSANPNALYFTAGINNGRDGLLGDIQATPEPQSLALALGGLMALFIWIRFRHSGRLG
jgi:uncharacterized protein (TIGR03118 family)